MESNAEDLSNQHGQPESASRARFLWWSLERRALLTMQAVLLSAAIIFAMVAGWRAWLSYHVHQYTVEAVGTEVGPQAASLPPGAVRAALLLREDKDLRSKAVVLSSQSYDFTQKLPPDLMEATGGYLALNADALASLRKALSTGDDDLDISFADEPYGENLRERMRWLGSVQLAEAVYMRSSDRPGMMVDALIRCVDLGVALRGVPDLRGQHDAQLIEWRAINPYMRRAVVAAKLAPAHYAALRARLLEGDRWTVTPHELAAAERLRILDLVGTEGNAAVVRQYGSYAQNAWQDSGNWRFASLIFGTDMADRYETLKLLQSIIDAESEAEALDLLRDARAEVADIGPMTTAVTERFHDLLWGRYVLEADRRVMACSFAVLQYQFEKGQLPESLDVLVPEYFDKLPEDPFRRLKPLNYVVTEDGFRIYSVGIDGDDDRGRESPQIVSPDGDIGFTWLRDGPPQNSRISSMPGIELPESLGEAGADEASADGVKQPATDATDPPKAPEPPVVDQPAGE